jgi:hypothetical protein
MARSWWLMPIIRRSKNQHSKLAWANSLRDPISKYPSQKRDGGVAQGVGSKFKCQYLKR